MADRVLGNIQCDSISVKTANVGSLSAAVINGGTGSSAPVAGDYTFSFSDTSGVIDITPTASIPLTGYLTLASNVWTVTKAGRYLIIPSLQLRDLTGFLDCNFIMQVNGSNATSFRCTAPTNAATQSFAAFSPVYVMNFSAGNTFNFTIQNLTSGQPIGVAHGDIVIIPFVAA